MCFDVCFFFYGGAWNIYTLGMSFEMKNLIFPVCERIRWLSKLRKRMPSTDKTNNCPVIFLAQNYMLPWIYVFQMFSYFTAYIFGFVGFPFFPIPYLSFLSDWPPLYVLARWFIPKYPQIIIIIIFFRIGDNYQGKECKQTNKSFFLKITRALCLTQKKKKRNKKTSIRVSVG